MFNRLAGFGIDVDFFSVSEETGDLGNVIVAQLLAFASQALAHLLPHVTGVDQLNFTLAMLGLAIGNDPDVGTDTGVVEHVGRQPDDGFQ